MNGKKIFCSNQIKFIRLSLQVKKNIENKPDIIINHVKLNTKIEANTLALS